MAAHKYIRFGAFALTPRRHHRNGDFSPAFYSIVTHKNAITNAYAHHSTLNTTEIITGRNLFIPFFPP